MLAKEIKASFVSKLAIEDLRPKKIVINVA